MKWAWSLALEMESETAAQLVLEMVLEKVRLSALLMGILKASLMAPLKVEEMAMVSDCSQCDLEDPNICLDSTNK